MIQIGPMPLERLRSLAYTKHAKEVMPRRCVVPGMVLETLALPEVAYPTRHAGRDAVGFSRRDLTVIVGEGAYGDPIVATTLLRSEARWTDEDARQAFEAWAAEYDPNRR